MMDDLRLHGMLGGKSTRINNQDIVQGILQGTVAQFDAVYLESIPGYTFTKLSDLTVLPDDYGRGVAFSHDNNYMAVAHDNAPCVTIYKRNGLVFDKLPNPLVLPTGGANGLAFSHNDNYLVVAHDNSPYLTIYKRTADNFAKLPNPLILPTGNAEHVAFSHDDTYLAVAHAGSPFLTIYKRTGDDFVKLSNPGILPANSAYKVAFSSDSTYLSVAHADLPYVTIYKRAGDVFNKLANPAVLPSSIARGVAFSQSGLYMAVTYIKPPYMNIYKRTGDDFAKLPDSMVTPNGYAYGVDFSESDTLMAVTFADQPGILVYERTGDAFTRLGDPPITKTIFNVTTYGAVADGVTDCRTAIQAAVDAASAVDGIVYFPPAYLAYKVSNYITLKSNIEIYGYGATLYRDSTAAVSLLLYRSNAVYISNVTIRGLALKSVNNQVGTGEYLGCLTSNVEGISIYGVNGLTIRDVIMDQLYMGLKLQAPTSGLNTNIDVDNLNITNTRNPLYMSHTNGFEMINSSLDATGGGTKFLHACYLRGNVSNCYFNNVKFKNTPGGGIHFYNSDGGQSAATLVTFDNCSIENVRAGVYLYSGANNITFNNLDIKIYGVGFKVNSANLISINGLTMSESFDQEEVGGFTFTALTNSTIDHAFVDGSTMSGQVFNMVSGVSGVSCTNFTAVNTGGVNFTAASGPVASMANKNLNLGNLLSEHYDITGNASPIVPDPPALPVSIVMPVPGGGRDVAFSSPNGYMAIGHGLPPYATTYKHSGLHNIHKSENIADLVGMSGAGYAKQGGILNETIEVVRIFR